jgi:hypothetical protein
LQSVNESAHFWRQILEMWNRVLEKCTSLPTVSGRIWHSYLKHVWRHCVYIANHYFLRACKFTWTIFLPFEFIGSKGNDKQVKISDPAVGILNATMWYSDVLVFFFRLINW